MKNTSRVKFNEYLARVATINAVGVSDTCKTFSVDPSVQQTLETKQQESSAFLSKINVVGVDEQMGEKLGIGVSGPVASRTNTNVTDRQTKDLSTIDSKGYLCVHTDFDTHLKYAKIDAWAKFKDFQVRVANSILKRQALDRIMIGFNGVSAAAQTDPVVNPMLQDVNKGWLQHLREDAPQNVLSSGKTAGKIIIGGAAATRDFANLDAAVMDAITLLDPWHQQDPDLIVILGRELMHDKYFPLVDIDQAPSEMLAADIVISQKRVGGLQAAAVPYFPANALMITTYDNLSLYWQEGGRRRHIIDNPKRSQIENYESSNDAYVVEDNGRAALVEKIELAA
ncbi:Phage major capsid protein, P2 family [compost metagenome]